MKKIYVLMSGVALMALSTFSLSAQTARVQVIHNSADVLADSVDIYLNGNLALDDFAYRTATPFLDIPTSSPAVIGVAPKTSSSYSDTLTTFSFNLMPNETYVVVADGFISPGYNPATPFNLRVFATGRESANTVGNTDVLVYHGSTDAPAVDVDEVSVPAGTVVNNLEFGNYAGYLELPTADYRLVVKDSTSSVSVKAYEAPLSSLGLQDSALTVVASGFLDPSNNNNGPDFGLWVALASGGNLIPLPESTTRVQVIHNSADALADSVDIYLNGALALDNFAYRTATPFLDLPAETPVVIGVAPKNSASYGDTLTTFTFTLDATRKYIVVANGLVDANAGYSPFVPFNLSVYDMAREEAAMTGNTDVLVHHGATDAPAVDVNELSVPAGTVVNNMEYGDFAGYLGLGTMDYVLEITDSTNSTRVELYDAPLATLGLQDSALTVIASGFLDPSNNNNGPGFGLWVALANGGNLIPLNSTIGLDEESNSLPLSAYPIPVKDELIIEGLVGEWQYQLTDYSGRVLKKGVLADQQALRLDQLPSGSYLLNLSRDGEARSLKIMK